MEKFFMWLEKQKKKKKERKLPWDNYTDTISNNRKSTVEITLQEFMYGHQWAVH